jgi:hypothetical protein
MSTGEKQYTQSVQTAYDAVSGLHMDEQYKLTAFRLILQQELGYISPLQQASSPTDADVKAQHRPVDKGSWQHKIASNLGITDEEVLEIYHFTEEGDIELVIENKDVPSVAAQAIKQIAKLYAGGRQAAGIENTTSVEAIRNVCENGYKVVDKKNFSTYINGLGAKFRVEGSGTEQKVQLINGAYGAVGEIAKLYLGEKK